MLNTSDGKTILTFGYVINNNRRPTKVRILGAQKGLGLGIAYAYRLTSLKVIKDFIVRVRFQVEYIVQILYLAQNTFKVV